MQSTGGFEAAFDGAAAFEYRDASCSVTLAVDGSRSPVHIDLTDLPVVWVHDAVDTTPQPILAARIIASLMDLGFDLRVSSDIQLNAAELLRVLLTMEAPSAIEFMHFLDTIEAHRTATLLMTQLSVSIDDAAQTAVTVFPVLDEGEGRPLCVSAPITEVLDLLADAIAAPGHVRMRSRFEWRCQGVDRVNPAQTIQRNELASCVGAPSAVVDVATSINGARCQLVIGEEGAAVMAGSVTAELLGAVTHESAILGLVHAVWGEGNRDAGDCMIRVTTSEAVHSMPDTTTDPEVAVTWLVEILERLDAKPVSGSQGQSIWN